MSELGTESAFTVLAQARTLEEQGHDVIHLEIGEPDFDTPGHISEAAFAAVRAGHTHYCPSAGLTEFRAAIATSMSRARGIEIPAERVLVGNGAKPFLFFTVLAVCEPGDEVVFPDPSFPIYESAIRWAGATPVPLALREERDYRFDPEELSARLNPRTKLVILNSPQNPTGGVLGAGDLEVAAEMIARTRAWVLSDEVYSRLLYEGSFASVAAASEMLERTVVLDGLSKTYAMTGWRCGYACVPERLVEPLTRFFVNSTSCVPPFIQHAGIAALEGPQDDVSVMLEEFRARRDLLITGLNELPGVSCRTPHGAFYAFPNVSALPISAERLATRLLEDAGVAVLAGSAFGAAGAGHLRLSYANSRANLATALERIRALLATLG
ncbi:MAG TPA: pyridoxal phosphate-dependent aminotransferase [Solirubrobacteraceae bacterium]|nr:pyridoxal phosphate-dependent aminotransferase [Solirubrobacteraceae bacterium]